MDLDFWNKEAVAESAPPPPRTSWTAAELMGMDFPEPRWAVPGIVAEGVTLLAGAPKVGKSWLGLGIAVAVALGGKALGVVDVQPGPVLYLALEDNARRLKSRLSKVLDHTDTPPETLTFSVVCETLPNGGANRIAGWLDKNPDARLVVVDVFARVRGAAPAYMSSYDADYMAMRALKVLADTYEVAILVVHHTRKAASEDFLDAVSGTNGLAGAADAAIVLRRVRGSTDAELHLTGRDVTEAEYALTFDPERGTWHLAGGSLAAAAEQAATVRVVENLADRSADIVRFVARHPQGVRAGDVAEALDITAKAATTYLGRLYDSGKLRKPERGLYTSVVSVVSEVLGSVAESPDTTLTTLTTQHCTVCGFPLNAALVTAGETTHATCEVEQ